MKRTITTAVCLLLTGAFGFSGAQAGCEDLYLQHRSTDLGLDYEGFDQSPGQGFRVLAMSGCHSEAADLIEDYIDANSATQNSLRWHVAQLRASAGEYELAIASARAALKESEDFSSNPLRWNDYVLATIAFLEKDREKLLKHRDLVADGDDYRGNAINLKLLNALVKHFDRSYLYATSHIE